MGVYDPDTGEKIHTVDLPVKRPSACAFGGPDLAQLFITTIQVGTCQFPLHQAGVLFHSAAKASQNIAPLPMVPQLPCRHCRFKSYQSEHAKTWQRQCSASEI